MPNELEGDASAYKLDNETIRSIGELAKQLYLYTDFDLWGLLCRYLDGQIAVL